MPLSRRNVQPKAREQIIAELVVDMVAGEYIRRNYEAAAMDGRILAFQRPPKFLVDFRPLLAKRCGTPDQAVHALMESSAHIGKIVLMN